jgi:hypothetical protein
MVFASKEWFSTQLNGYGHLNWLRSSETGSGQIKRFTPSSDEANNWVRWSNAYGGTIDPDAMELSFRSKRII